MLGLKITIKKGKTQDEQTEYFFEHTKDYIVIGSDAKTCDVAFDEGHKASGVANEHIAFKRSLGHYQIDLNTHHYVLIDGKEPFEEQEISGTSTLVLGEEVTIEVTVMDNRIQPADLGKKHVQPGAKVQKHSKFLKVAFIGILAVGLFAFLIQKNLSDVETNIAVSQESIDQTVEKFDALTAELERVQGESENISPTTIEKVTQSVYLVLVRNKDGGERPAGTAWVFNDAQLATNAHVAEAFYQLKANEQLIVRAPTSPYKTHVVKSALLHPGYKHYQKLWQQYLPTQKVGDRLSLMHTASPADVAVLSLEDATGLNPPLELLPTSELASIKSGIKVAYVGYPGERLLPGSYKRPAPVAQQDEVIRVTDFFLTRQNNNRLIHHGLPLTGGASGSPMFNAKGQVIGLISSMNITYDANGRAPNAADVNMCQRIDFLYDLMADPDQALTRLDKEWQASMSNYYAGRSQSYKSVLDKIEKVFSTKGGKQVDSVNRSKTTKPDTAKLATYTEKLYVKDPGLHAVVLSTDNQVAKFNVIAKGNKNLTVLNYPIKYSNFVRYGLILVNEPGELEIKVAFKKAPRKASKLNYKISQHYWAGKINPLVSAYTESLGQLFSEDAEKFKLVKQANKLAMAKQVKQYYLTGFNYTLSKPGYYAFVSVPQSKGEVDIMLINRQQKVVKKEESKNGVGLTVYKNNKANNLLHFISYSNKRDVVQNMSVYYLPFLDKSGKTGVSGQAN